VALFGDRRGTVNQVRAEFSTESESMLDLRQLRVPIVFFAACLAAQLYLVFFKSFNWDEFLHFSRVYQLRAGTSYQPFQVFSLRLLWWAPAVSSNLVNQMLAARIFAWIAHLVTLFIIYAIARHFFSPRDSFFAAFAYLAAGFVFTQSFSIRADPIVTATLVAALYLMVCRQLSLTHAALVGALIGLAGMMTLKAIIYAPCFAGVAWLKWREAANKRQTLICFAALVCASLLTFLTVYLFHTSGIPRDAKPMGNVAFYSVFVRWLTTDQPYSSFILGELILGVVFFSSVALAPYAWNKIGLKSEQKVALMGFVAPLAVLPFYRNTFPYFFTFLLAPVAIVIPPALAIVRDRYSDWFLAFVLAAVPLSLAVLEPRDVLRNQHALIDYVHQEYPSKTGYLDYSGMIADYPRVLEFLTTGNGARLYTELGNAIVGREIDRGNVPFIIGNQETVLAALEDRPIPGTFLPGDLEAMDSNYVRQWGVLWREGKLIPPGSTNFSFHLRRGGEFVVDGGPVTIDGIKLNHNVKISLLQGDHLASGERGTSVTLWRGQRLPGPHPNLPMEKLFTDF